MSQHRAAGFTGSQLLRWVGRKGGPAPNLNGSIPYPALEKMGGGQRFLIEKKVIVSPWVN